MNEPIYFIGVGRDTFRPSKAARVIGSRPAPKQGQIVSEEPVKEYVILYDDGLSDVIRVGDMLGAMGTREELSRLFDRAQMDEAFKEWKETEPNENPI